MALPPFLRVARDWPAATRVAVIAAAFTGLTALVSFLLYQTTRYQVEVMRSQVEVMTRQLEEHAAPNLKAIAFYLRTPVPHFPSLMQTLGQDTTFPADIRPDQRKEFRSELQKASNMMVITKAVSDLLESPGAWQVTVWNSGDATADSVKVSAPGAFFARVNPPGVRGWYWDLLDRETVELGDLGPQQRAGIVLWITPGRVVREACGLADFACFTEKDLAVFADNAAAKIELIPWRFPPTEAAEK